MPHDLRPSLFFNIRLLWIICINYIRTKTENVSCEANASEHLVESDFIAPLKKCFANDVLISKWYFFMWNCLTRHWTGFELAFNWFGDKLGVDYSSHPLASAMIHNLLKSAICCSVAVQSGRYFRINKAPCEKWS